MQWKGKPTCNSHKGQGLNEGFESIVPRNTIDLPKMKNLLRVILSIGKMLILPKLCFTLKYLDKN